MNDTVEKRKEQEKENQEKFAVQIVYNGVTKPLEVDRNQHVTVVLQRSSNEQSLSLESRKTHTSCPSSVKTEAWYPKQIL